MGKDSLQLKKMKKCLGYVLLLYLKLRQSHYYLEVLHSAMCTNLSLVIKQHLYISEN